MICKEKKILKKTFDILIIDYRLKSFLNKKLRYQDGGIKMQKWSKLFQNGYSKIFRIRGYESNFTIEKLN